MRVPQMGHSIRRTKGKSTKVERPGGIEASQSLQCHKFFFLLVCADRWLLLIRTKVKDKDKDN